MILIQCPSCSEKFRTRDNLKGKHAMCPACRGSMIVDKERLVAKSPFLPSTDTQAVSPPIAGKCREIQTQSTKGLQLDLGDRITMDLALIPAGKFMMGSPNDEKDRSGDEGPQHNVMISRPFYMGVYAVTQAQYEQVMGKNPSNTRGPQNPVEMVSWNDAVDFCRNISQKTGQTAHLPTEPQWEYACRAESTTRFHYGNDDDYSKLGDYAWYKASSKSKAQPVGRKKPNSWGLYDMQGNVWQWCSTWFGAYRCGEETDPQGPDSGSSRVLRGGGWGNLPQSCRSAFRSCLTPDNRDVSCGFRVVVDLK